MIVDLIEELLSPFHLRPSGSYGLQVAVNGTSRPIVDDPAFGFGCTPGWNYIYLRRGADLSHYLAQDEPPLGNRRIPKGVYIGAIMVKNDHSIVLFHQKATKMTLGDLHG